jgi:hypothetical protein
MLRTLKFTGLWMMMLVWKDFEGSQISLGSFATKASELFEDAAKQIHDFTFSKE